MFVFKILTNFDKSWLESDFQVLTHKLQTVFFKMI